MKKLAFLFLIMSACSSDIYVFTDYDREFDLSSYSCYRWSEIKNIEINRNPLYYNELNDKRIKFAVSKRMNEKGYKEDSQSKELVLHYHIAVTDVIAYREDPMFHHEAGWLRPEIASYKYNEGTIIIDVMDSDCRCLIWRGYASQILDSWHPELADEKINQSIAKIFAKFPTTRKQVAATN
jgi:hypothetical protein